MRVTISGVRRSDFWEDGHGKIQFTQAENTFNLEPATTLLTLEVDDLLAVSTVGIDLRTDEEPELLFVLDPDGAGSQFVFENDEDLPTIIDVTWTKS